VIPYRVPKTISFDLDWRELQLNYTKYFQYLNDLARD
jgi:hypothetical protein